MIKDIWDNVCYYNDVTLNSKLTDEHRRSIVARVIWTLPLTILHPGGVDPEHVVLEKGVFIFDFFFCIRYNTSKCF